MFPLLFWGLPTRHDDPLLFGDGPPWPAERYRAAAAVRTLRTGPIGADVDVSPLEHRDRIVELTATEPGRAEILRRYRLYSRQPDEMITFRALMRMDPRKLDFDPRLYQYGGTYVYAVGATLALGAAAGLLRLTSDVGFYLTHPDAFGRFYVAARLLTLIFGAGLLAGVARLGRRAGGRTGGWIAALLVALCPVFISGVLEAKPHVPAACMIVWAILAAIDWTIRHRRRDAVRLGLLSGLAGSLVLSGWAVLAAWVPLVKGRRARGAGIRSEGQGARGEGERTRHERRGTRDMGRGVKSRGLSARAAHHPQTAPRRGTASTFRLTHLLAALGIALLVYVVTNPYLVWHALRDAAALRSNLGNTAGMYTIGGFGAGLLRTARLMVESVGIGVVTLTVLAMLPLARGQGRPFWIAAAPSLLVLAVAVAVGGNKPAEFARFLLVPAVLACVASAAAVARVSAGRPAAAIALTIVLLATMRTRAYVHSFVQDVGRVNESRHAAARWIATNVPRDEPVGVVQEPAPYCVPPMDFAHRTVLWLPPARPAGLDPATLPAVLVCTADEPESRDGAWWREYYELKQAFPSERRWLSPITWANKLVLVFERVEPRVRPSGPRGSEPPS